MQMLQAEVSRLHHRLERCLKERERLVSASETTVQESHHRPRTSTPRVRLVLFHLIMVCGACLEPTGNLFFPPL